MAGDTPQNCRDPNINISLTGLSVLVRWGRNVTPTWIHAVEVVAPLAGTVLVSKTVTAAMTGFLYGFFIETQEPNDFLINWTSGGVAKSIRISFAAKGTVESVDFVAMNEGLPADAGTAITITNVSAGNVGIIYQARLLYAEL
jgi:hypothetical protein